MTVTVQRETTKSKAPGDTDVGVAEKVLQFAGELWDEQQSGVRKNFLFSLSELLWVKVQEMTGREDIYWFDPIRLRREMEYTCDMKLEGPAVVDCAKLEYHGLGHGVVEFDKGETKYFNQGRAPAMGLFQAEACANFCLNRFLRSRRLRQQTHDTHLGSDQYRL